MPSIGIYLVESDSMQHQHAVHEPQSLDSWSAEEGDYIDSAYREKRKLIF